MPSLQMLACRAAGEVSALAVPVSPVTEAQLQATVLSLAKLHRWRSLHIRPGLTQSGNWRTAVAGDGKGFPDLLLLKRGRLIFAELKSEIGRVETEQHAWLLELSACPNVEVYIWRPRDLQRIAEILGASAA